MATAVKGGGTEGGSGDEKQYAILGHDYIGHNYVGRSYVAP